MQLRRILIAATLVAVLASGCGSSSHSSTTSGSTSSTAGGGTTTTTGNAIGKAFVARATTICEASNTRLGDAARAAFGNRRPDASHWRTFALAKVIPLVKARIDAIQ